MSSPRSALSKASPSPAWADANARFPLHRGQARSSPSAKGNYSTTINPRPRKRRAKAFLTIHYPLTTIHYPLLFGRSGLRPSLVQGLRPRNAPLQNHPSPTVFTLPQHRVWRTESTPPLLSHPPNPCSSPAVPLQFRAPATPPSKTTPQRPFVLSAAMRLIQGGGCQPIHDQVARLAAWTKGRPLHALYMAV